MRFTSLAVELLRSRPVLVFWSAVLAIAALWFAVAMVFYTSPPDDVARVIAVGREYQLGTPYGPPLSYWLADITFRAAGNHMLGVYLLAQVCLVATFGALFALSRALVGSQHAVLACFLTLTIVAFGFPNLEFGPAVLARPLWALTMLFYWRAVGQGRRKAWFVLSIVAGLLLLTSYTGFMLIALLAVFSAAHPRARRVFATTDPWFSLLVVGVILAPFVIWLSQSGIIASQLPQWPSFAELKLRLAGWPLRLGAILLMLSGIALLVAFNVGRLGRQKAGDAPMIFRTAPDSFGRVFVFVFAIAPPLVATLIAALADYDRSPATAGVLLEFTGLAVILLAGNVIYLHHQRLSRLIWLSIIVTPAVIIVFNALVEPWTTGPELKTSLPATKLGRFFGDSFERRTGMALPTVTGDSEIAALVALGAKGRPHLFLAREPERTPWITAQNIRTSGGLVVWRASESNIAPPDDLKRLFPDLVPEVPHVFERWVRGRRPPLRVGWAIIRPPAGAVSPAK